MQKLVLIRHGQSLWNKANRFTGWVDVDLSEQGLTEARSAGRLLSEHGFDFDVVHTSLLKRAIRTMWISLDELDRMWLPVHRSWRLNERHYGALQGLNKAETVEQHGAEQVLIWRRSYDTPPPPMDRNDPEWAGREPRYAEVPADEIPCSESLSNTVDRVLPYWNDVIRPQVADGKRVLVVAHGNSLRALIKHFDGISDEEIVGLNLPTGVPIVYDIDESGAPVNREFLGDADAIAAAMEAVKNQGKN
ncbi:MAG: 2,3-diphosphoglycerate-dependent phosphoglycerate mutase [Phycisphaerae bacterium]|nr:2,3-diphosphoglycerate-dependent phosphoglycerate mutase [Phycisphaerae bacterium]|tara:strand:- start:9617 stop:10360 length:744 start_codon:yes stop_codon:yes gene_type:complete